MRTVVVVRVVPALLAAGGGRGPSPAGPMRRPLAAGPVGGRDLRPMRRLIRCAARIRPIPGGARRAFEVARCESGLHLDAYGWGNAGAFRHRAVYWRERAVRWLRPAWFGEVRVPSPYNARANVIVAVRMAHSGGSGPWACA